jgi:CheY-like chemotaxis protein
MVKCPLQIVVSSACEDLAPGSARRKRVLLVDDNIVNQKVCLHMLGMLGFDAIVANNGQECLNILLRSDPLFFDAILMDFHMPVLGTAHLAVMVDINNALIKKADQVTAKRETAKQMA